jgi:hypothetical protein
MNPPPSLHARQATPLPGTRNTVFRAGLGAALLALTASCSGDMGVDSDAIDAELVGEVSELGVSASAEGLELAAAVDKAQFLSNPTFDGFPVPCNTSRRQTINNAETRAGEILNATIIGTEQVNLELLFPPIGQLSLHTRRFILIFDDGITDLFTMTGRIRKKLVNIRSVMAAAFHTCHDEDESVLVSDEGEFVTCRESDAFASTNFAGGAENAVRWCDIGLEQSQDEIAITLMHELSHQDRTADETGTRVEDDNRNGLMYNAHNLGRWMREHR